MIAAPAMLGIRLRLTARVRRGSTIILTTHILEVAERLADRIGIIVHGRLIAEGTLDELRAVAVAHATAASNAGPNLAGGQHDG